MTNILIGVHAALGEIGVLSFLWCIVELLNPTDKRIKRAIIASVLGTIFIFASWVAGGYYYVNFYGENVKPVIKEGLQPWAHSVVTETKEHVFLFLPFISLLATSLLVRHKKRLIKEHVLKKAVISLCWLVVLIGLAMAGMGYIISSSFRSSIGG